MACLQKMNAACREEIRIPRLLGYVKHAEEGYIVGFLRQWAPSGLDGGLRDVEVSKISTERRRKWVAQMRETVEKLHEIGVVWGDGKIDNVVIDEKDDAWLIDFGGGWTEGWVDEKLADTIEGDVQAVKHIAEFLDVD
jgi:serine/threonine protein kinase